MPVTYSALYAASDQSNPAGARFLTEATWTEDPRRAFRLLADAIAAAPSPLSYAIANVTPAGGFVSRPLPNAAFSMAAPGFGAVYAIWRDAADEAANVRWLRNCADALSPVTRGYYVGEADLQRPERLEQCYGADAWERLKTLRANYDPAGTFRRAIPSAAANPLAIAAE